MQQQLKHHASEHEWGAAHKQNRRFFEEKKRPDELVILNDLRAVLGPSEFVKYVVPQEKAAYEHLATARRFIGSVPILV